jgi:hypothetical protein
MKAIGHLNAVSTLYSGKVSQIITGSSAVTIFFIDREISRVDKETVTPFQSFFFIF